MGTNFAEQLFCAKLYFEPIFTIGAYYVSGIYQSSIVIIIEMCGW